MTPWDKTRRNHYMEREAGIKLDIAHINEKIGKIQMELTMLKDAKSRLVDEQLSLLDAIEQLA